MVCGFSGEDAPTIGEALGSITGAGLLVLASFFILFYFLKNSLRTWRGSLWYAAGNPDGFRFGAVNRPSPPRAIYMKTVKLQSARCLKTGRPGN